jgi:hypothetical protein
MPAVERALQAGADADLRARANNMSGGRIHSAHTAMVREAAKDDYLPDTSSTKSSAALATTTCHRLPKPQSNDVATWPLRAIIQIYAP